MSNTLSLPQTIGSDIAQASSHCKLRVPSAPGRHMPWVYTLFFFSGFPALIYQIVWQRSLFVIYGINIESVTIVVSAFMLGLGLGSLFGGMFSKYKRLPLLAIFGGIELGIAVFGVMSLRLFHWVGNYTVTAPPLLTGLMTFLLLLIPTILMGSTLPFLVAHLVRISGNVGKSVGSLYFVNTLGSAVACLLCALFIMRALGESGSISLAAAVNAIVGCLGIFMYFYGRNRPGADTAMAEEQSGHLATPEAMPLAFWVAVVVVGLSGFISLSYELLWYRAYSYASGTHARAFALLLAAYLEGIAFGSLFSRSLCQSMSSASRPKGLFAASALVMLANISGFLVIPALAFSARFVGYAVTFPLVTISACLLGAVFPLVCHLAIVPDYRAGARLSYLYLANIAGSVLGTLLIGFILMDHWSIRQISVFLALLGLLLGAALFLPIVRRVRLAASLCIITILAAAITKYSEPLFDKVYERLLYKSSYQPGMAFLETVETRSGVINTTPDGTILGGGVYDGRYNVSLTHDTNMLVRCYAISAFHPAPKQVLMIGLSSGSWAQVIANMPGVEKLTIVEINPGYLELIPKHREVSGLLKNSKVAVVIDDGRRWLVRHPEKKFDVIAMNTSYHWRAHSTNLLGVSFLQLARTHLLPGGILYYNTTWSGEVMLTGATVYPYALRVLNFLAVSDSPITVDQKRWRSVLENYKIEGKPVFDLNAAPDRARLEEVLALTDTLHGNDHTVEAAMEDQTSIRQRFQGKRIITDDNMGSEWNATIPSH